MKLLIVDLLAERKAFGQEGVREIISHFDNPEVYLWSPHTSERIEYDFGKVVEQPIEADFVVITGSRRNVSQWEPWMDDVAKLIHRVEVPMIGICFGHQIIAASLGGKVIRAKKPSKFVAMVKYNDGREINALFTHQDHVIDPGEMEVIATSKHCGIVACKHPTRNIQTVQYHPEATAEVIAKAVEYGDMSEEESKAFDLSKSLNSLKEVLL
jgi:GMP synthase-like glutamine amidotransferase